MPSHELEEKVLVFINRLAYQQAVKKVKTPLKAPKRVVSGLNEVRRTFFSLNEKIRAKLLVVALNINRNELKTGYDEQVLAIIRKARELRVPVAHCSSRSRLGRAMTGKFGPKMGLVSVINPESSEDQFEEIKQILASLTQAYFHLDSFM
jgi:ribosomal protein L7Ae-like RNA K-turn-binding protein